MEGINQIWSSEDLLIRILSYLNGKELKEVRKVCKNWNSLATISCFGRPFLLNVLTLGEETFDHLALSSKLQCPQIFFQNIVFHAVRFDANTNSVIYPETPCLPFLENIGYSHLIRQVKIRGLKQVLLLGKASQNGLLPNLTHLELRGEPEEANQSIILSSHAFPFVKTLVLFDEDYPQYQCVVSSCPKLLSLSTRTLYNLPTPNKLRELIINLPKPRTIAYVDKLEEFLGTQCESLRKLTITEFPELPAILETKPLLYLEKITLNLSSATEDTMDFQNLFSGIPNVKQVKVWGFTDSSRTWENVVFHNKLRQLEKLQFTMKDPENWNPSWIKVWQSLLPTGNPRLWVVAFIPFYIEENWFTIENHVEDALNLEVPNLILSLQEPSSFSTIVRLLFLVEVKQLKRREQRFRLVLRNNEYPTTETEREKDIRLLPAVLAKLAIYWRRVEFIYFRIPANTLEIVKSYLKDAPIAAEIYA